MQWVSTTSPPLQPSVVPLQPSTEILQQKGKNKWYMKPSLRGKVATCKDHRIGEMSVIDIATSTGELPHYPTAARRRRSRCHCGGGRRAAGEQSGGPADQEEGGGSFAKPDTFCELACLALWRLCMRSMTWPSVASADPSPAGHINDNNPDL